MPENKPDNPDKYQQKEHQSYRLTGINCIVANSLPEVMVSIQITRGKF